MKIGIPKEIKTNEKRVALVPAGAAALAAAGHTVIVETGAGLGSDFTDAQ
ncbi:MAG TPA: alanine dehydrogenase, partial [Gallionella sp.]|nr:alanine dehydrogenase [Gallionella sp.]